MDVFVHMLARYAIHAILYQKERFILLVTSIQNNISEIERFFLKKITVSLMSFGEFCFVQEWSPEA